MAAIALCPKLQLVATGSAGRVREIADLDSGALRIWSVDQELIADLGYTKWVRCLHFTPDAAQLVAAMGTARSLASRYSESSNLITLSVPDFVEQKSIRVPGIIVGMDISSDGKLLATVAAISPSSSRIQLWQLPELTIVDSFHVDGAVKVVSVDRANEFLNRPAAFSPDGNYLAVCSTDESKRSSTVTLRDIVARNNVAEYVAKPAFQYEEYDLTFVVFRPDGKCLSLFGRHSPTLALAVPSLTPTKCTADAIGADGSLYFGNSSTGVFA